MLEDVLMEGLLGRTPRNGPSHDDMFCGVHVYSREIFFANLRKSRGPIMMGNTNDDVAKGFRRPESSW